MSDQTPMMRQYLALKEEHPDAILLFRMGDFYEMFHDDARIAAAALDLTLTSRDKGRPNPVPMAGLPYHALQNYLGTLVKKGFNVAICEQIEDPKLAKGIVKREVVRVITPGTLTDPELLDAREQNFLASIAWQEKPLRLGLSFVDISTGEFYLTEFAGERAWELLREEVGRLAPAELLLPENLAGVAANHGLSGKLRVTRRPAAQFEPEAARAALIAHFRVQSLTGFGCEGLPIAVAAAGANLRYLEDTQRSGIPHLRGLHVYQRERYMVLDEATRRNLELTRTTRENKRRGSLLDHLDRTASTLGSRLMQSWLLRPLVDVPEITRRLDGVEELRERYLLRHELRGFLGQVTDIERLSAKVGLGSANSRDLASIRETLEQVPGMYGLLAECRAELLGELREGLRFPGELLDLLRRAIVDNPPATVREGGMIREGYHAELDELRQLESNGEAYIADLERREQNRTGLKLKVGFNRVFGYYIEMPRSSAANAPADFIRKQTLANAERFITPELKEYEEKVLHAQERAVALEYDLFQEVLRSVAAAIPTLQRIAESLAALDVLAGLAELAQEFGYVRPTVNTSGELRILGGRHPVVEALRGRHAFVANDCVMREDARRLLIITGPNMAGKSTYIRQVALITLLAQVGSFVPADLAVIGLVDRIFTRVGASDSLAGGESTFMVEMNETANILNNATGKSLLILDEIGRGTSTFDGLSIAWATAEYLHEMPHLRCRTLFATHYHELTDLSITHALATNISVAVEEHLGEVSFLHRVVEGPAGKSFGIQVARLAGMPREVIERSQEILENLEANELDPAGTPTIGKSKGRGGQRKITKVGEQFVQLSLFSSDADQLRKRLLEVVPERLTPLEALQVLSELRKLV